MYLYICKTVNLHNYQVILISQSFLLHQKTKYFSVLKNNKKEISMKFLMILSIDLLTSIISY